MGFWDSFKAAFLGGAGVDYYAMKTRDEVQGLRNDLGSTGSRESDLSNVGDGAFNRYTREFDRLDRGVQMAIAKYRLEAQGSEATAEAVAKARASLRTSIRETVEVLSNTKPVSSMYLKVSSDFVGYKVGAESLLRALDESSSGSELEARRLTEFEEDAESLRTALTKLSST